MEQEHFEELFPENARYSEIEKIAHFIREGTSCQLLGIPGTGRSTLTGLLTYNSTIRQKHFGDDQKLYHFTVVNFSEIRKRPLFDAMKFLFLNLADSLRQRKLTEEYLIINNLFHEHLSFNDELVLFQGLKQAIDYLAFDKKLTIVFLFERFEEYIPTVTSDFFTNLRTLRNRAKYQFSVVFSLNRPLESLLEPALLADFYDFVATHHVYLRLLDEPSMLFRTSYTEKLVGKTIPKNIFHSLVEITGGHAMLVRLGTEALLAETPESEITDFLLTKKTILATLMSIWLWLSPSEQADLLQENFDDKEIISTLEDIGLIKNNKIQIPLFAKFIASQLKKTEIIPAHIVYDEHTNTIKKGDTILSDQLTASEFRLLRYMLQNADRIVERDELINVVWENMKSTAGITDQAVDQLVFRVRKKIEEDPNNPIHLQTVKGRGFKFAL